MKHIVILGGGGHAHVIADIITASGDVVEAFLDDNTDLPDIAGPISNYVNYSDCEFVIGIGNAKARETLSAFPVKWYTAIHPSAIISPSTSIGAGTVIMPNVVVNSRSKIGMHCIINTSAVVEHDNVIEDFSHVSVGVKLGGNVNIGRNTWVGIGATVSNNINIVGGCMVGAGAVVVKDIVENGTYFGVPARMAE